MCTALEETHEHFASVYQDKGNNTAVCKACGSKTIWICGKCGKAMCTHKERGNGTEAHAFLDTVATSSSAFSEVTNRKLKVRVYGSECHMGGILIGGRPSWNRISRRNVSVGQSWIN